jgi:hypothetical protein
MDRFVDELNKSSQALVEAENRLLSIRAAVHAVEKDLAILNSVEANLLENMRVMKRRRMIVLAHEFRKAMKDLETCRARMAFLRIDLDNNLRIMHNTEMDRNKVKARFDAAYERVHNPPNNVIPFRKKVIPFRKKDGKE